MTDRQDIDALLISALYGELTPADEARLQTHLDSHPADRSALADMTLARNAIRESRILTVQLEPPQAVSALLLQEAARRAPKVQAKEARDAEKAGWFARFTRSFMAHPAMAAAAMLVLVIGVASAVYVRRGNHLAEPSVATSPSLSAPQTPAGDNAVTESARLARQAGSAYEAQLQDQEASDKQNDTSATFGGTEKSKRGEATPETVKPQVAALPPAPTPEPKKAPPRRTDITGPRVTLAPKDVDARPAQKSANRRETEDSIAKVGAANGVGGAVPTPTPTVTPEPDPAPATVVDGRADARAPARNAPGVATTPPPVIASDRVSPAEEQPKQTEDTSWAREVHVKVVNAVKANNCREASQLALALSTRAPGYYSQNVENDRSLKQCVTYINAEREKEADKVQRARAQRRSADEAPKASKPASSSK